MDSVGITSPSTAASPEASEGEESVEKTGRARKKVAANG
jgi:hypothetical protein